MGQFIEKENTRGSTDLEKAIGRSSGDPFNIIIRQLIQEETGVSSWLHEADVQTELKTGKRYLLTIII